MPKPGELGQPASPGGSQREPLLPQRSGASVSSGLLPRHSAHSPRSQRPALWGSRQNLELAGFRGFPGLPSAMRLNWSVWGRRPRIGGGDRSWGRECTWASDPPWTLSVRRVGQRRDSWRPFASPSGRPCERCFRSLDPGLSTHRIPAQLLPRVRDCLPARLARSARQAVLRLPSPSATPEAQPNSRRASPQPASSSLCESM